MLDCITRTPKQSGIIMIIIKRCFHQLQEIQITQHSTFNIFVHFLCSVICGLEKRQDYKILPMEKTLQKKPDVLKPAVNCSNNLRLRSVS